MGYMHHIKMYTFRGTATNANFGLPGFRETIAQMGYLAPKYEFLPMFMSCWCIYDCFDMFEPTWATPGVAEVLYYDS